jgi:hypothetical protein
MGSWLGKIFGGIAQNRQARDYTQMRADLMMLQHDLGKESVTHKAVTEAAVGDYTANKQSARGRRDTKWHDEHNTKHAIWSSEQLKAAGDRGVNVNPADIGHLQAFDKQGRPIRQKKSFNEYTPSTPKADKKPNNTTDGGPNTPPPGGGNPPPPGGGAATASKPTRAKKAAATPQATAADVTAPEVKPARKPRAPKAGA